MKSIKDFLFNTDNHKDLNLKDKAAQLVRHDRPANLQHIWNALILRKLVIYTKYKSRNRNKLIKYMV